MPNHTIWTPVADQKLRKYLRRDGYEIPAGLGTKEAACSIAAINLALTGDLIDTIPGCMSLVVGNWLITTQDSMSSQTRNSQEWRRLLPLAAGTGREREAERIDIILDWMWGTVLPSLQSLADKYGYGVPWRRMCENRTEAAANAAATAADNNHRSMAYVWTSARASARAAAIEAASASAASSECVWSAAWSGTRAARAAGEANGETARETGIPGARVAASNATWDLFDPPGLLRRLVEVQ